MLLFPHMRPRMAEGVTGMTRSGALCWRSTTRPTSAAKLGLGEERAAVVQKVDAAAMQMISAWFHEFIHSGKAGPVIPFLGLGQSNTRKFQQFAALAFLSVIRLSASSTSLMEMFANKSFSVLLRRIAFFPDRAVVSGAIRGAPAMGRMRERASHASASGSSKRMAEAIQRHLLTPGCSHHLNRNSNATEFDQCTTTNEEETTNGTARHTYPFVKDWSRRPLFLQVEEA